MNDAEERSCGFCVEILAPEGLVRVERFFGNSLLPLRSRISGYNGQVILVDMRCDWFEWAMDPSDTDYMFGSGSIVAPPEAAELMVKWL
jgi:hypothetical protein